MKVIESSALQHTMGYKVIEHINLITDYFLRYADLRLFEHSPKLN